ncbi:MAG: lactate utilization protein C [Burkholderiaceae bacterium]
MSLDTARARAAIFDRIRLNQGRDANAASGERQAAADYLASHACGPRPAIDRDRVDRFRAMSERMASTVQTVARVADAPAAVAAYLAAHGLPARAVVWPALASLGWHAAGIEAEARAPHVDESQGRDAVGITGVFCALAETGTLVLLSGPDSPASTHLLPETHVAVVPASRVVASMEDAFALMRSERGGLPRAVNMVSGPSRTGDIEQTIVLGAHGPYRVHILIAAAE